MLNYHRRFCFSGYLRCSLLDLKITTINNINEGIFENIFDDLSFDLYIATKKVVWNWNLVLPSHFDDDWRYEKNLLSKLLLELKIDVCMMATYDVICYSWQIFCMVYFNIIVLQTYDWFVYSLMQLMLAGYLLHQLSE